MKLGTRCLEVKKNIKALADGIKEKYGKDSSGMESISNYIDWIHMTFIILARDTGAKGLSMTKTSDIPGTSVSSDEPTHWFAGEFFKGNGAVDKLAYIADKTRKKLILWKENSILQNKRRRSRRSKEKYAQLNAHLSLFIAKLFLNLTGEMRRV